MGCSHTRECPLFPLLNASLRDWRNYYCDSEDGWQKCARYQLSKTGQLVPISLLPNGADAVHLKGIPVVHTSETATPGRVPPPEPEPEVRRGFELPPVPTGQHNGQQYAGQQHAGQYNGQEYGGQQYARQRYAGQNNGAQPQGSFNGFVPASAPNRVPPPAVPVARPAPPVSQATRPAPKRRRWWNRLADWIAGPA